MVLGFGIIVCSIYPSSTSLLETWNYKSDVTKVNFDEIITRYKKAALGLYLSYLFNRNISKFTHKIGAIILKTS